MFTDFIDISASVTPNLLRVRYPFNGFGATRTEISKISNYFTKLQGQVLHVLAAAPVQQFYYSIILRRFNLLVIFNDIQGGEILSQVPGRVPGHLQ